MGLEGVVEDYALYGQGKAFAASIGSGDVQVKHSQDGDDPKSDEIPF